MKSLFLKKIYDISKKNKAFRKLAKNGRNLAGKISYGIKKNGTTIKENKVFLMAYKGSSYSCSPKAIYLEMIKDPKFSSFEFVWAFNKVEDYSFLLNNMNTRVVSSSIRTIENEIASSKYIITNFRLPDQIIPSDKQVYVQCWHGTPLKRLGFDIKKTDNVMNSIEEIRYLYESDAKRFKYLISANKFSTEKFITAWNLEELNKTHIIIEEGYPRNDILFKYNKEYTDNVKDKIFKGFNIEKKKIILFAPTWRDDQHNSSVGYEYNDLMVDLDRLKEEISDDYVVVVRLHYIVANKINFSKYEGFVFDASIYDDIGDLYTIADMLITDYSSVFFDYGNLKKPILFYMYDLGKYSKDMRGLYLNLDELPGEIIETEDDLIKAIKTLDYNTYYNDKYKKFNEKFNYLDDGESAKRVINKIFNH